MRVAALRGGYSGLFIRGHGEWRGKMDTVVRRWLTILAESGVDLEAYFTREHALIIEETRNEAVVRRLIPRLEEINSFPSHKPDLYYEWDTVPCQLTVMDF